jgi:hypothetical protein
MKYYILSSDVPTFELLFDMCAESDMISEEGDPYILLDDKEYKSFLKAEKAYNEWQDKIGELYCKHKQIENEKLNKANAVPREPFQTMEDYDKEVREFLK